MAGIALLGSAIEGMTSGNNCTHLDEFGNPIHGAVPITGSIVSGCSDFVFVNDVAVATVGSITEEFSICTDGYGEVSEGSNFVFIKGISVARVGDSIEPHDGTGEITTGSTFVFEGR